MSQYYAMAAVWLSLRRIRRRSQMLAIDESQGDVEHVSIYVSVTFYAEWLIPAGLSAREKLALALAGGRSELKRRAASPLFRQ